MSTKKAESSKIKSVLINSNYGKSTDVAGGIRILQIFESVFDVSVRSTFEIFDTGFRGGSGGTVGGLEENDLNLTVGEKVQIKVEDNYENSLDINLIVQNVGSVVEHTQYNGYVISCYSEECVNNEFVENRVVKRYEGKITSHVPKIISENLKSGKSVKIDTCINNLNFLGHLQKPFYTLTWLAKRTAPDLKFGTLAGYLFWETTKGYNYRSIDKIFIEKNIVKKFIYTNTNKTPPGYDANILDYSWSENIDLESKLLTSAFNKSQGRRFDPYKHAYVEDEFDSSGQFGDNIGGLEKPKIATSLGVEGKATRIASNFLDTGVLPPGFDLKTQLKKSKDFINFDIDKILRQSFIRYNNLFSHKLSITIPGDFSIHAGDLVWCDFPEISDKINQLISRKKSGIYMVIDISHYITPRGTFTGLNLARESIYRPPVGSASGKFKNSNDAVS